MATRAEGAQAQLAMDAAGTAVGSFTEPYEFVSESLRKQGVILETEGIRGTRSHSSERTRQGPYAVLGSIVFNPSPVMLDKLLPRILGAAEDSDQFDLAETLPEFSVLVDRVTRRFLYDHCKVSRAVFRGRQGELLELELEIVAATEAVSATAFPSLSMPVDPPYQFIDGTLSLQGASRESEDFELIIDNLLEAKFRNSQSATDISPRDRTVTFRCTTPFSTDEVALYNQSLAGAAGTLTFAQAGTGYSLQFSMATVQFPDRSPVVSGKTEIPLVLEGVARASGSTAELVVSSG